MMSNGWQKIVVITLGATLALATGAFAQQSQTAPAPNAATASSPQVPQPDQGGVNWSGAGYGAAALLGNVLYIPAKLVYAVVGGVTGGAGYLVTGGNSQTADTIWRSSLGGDYVLTPKMVEGQQAIHFSGPTQTSPGNASTVAGAATPPASGAVTGTAAPAANSGVSASASSSGPTVQSLDSGGGPVDSSTKPVPAPDNSIE